MWAILIGFFCFIFLILSVGSISALFLFLLERAFQSFLSHDHLILLLPFFGLLTGVCYWVFGKKIPNTKRILHELQEDQKSLRPLLTTGMIFTFTILSQFFGASTGRESTAVQFGASLGDFWRHLFEKKFKTFHYSRQAFIRSGLAAGFGAVFGVPWAGSIFALEVTPNIRWPFRYLPLCWLSSFGAHWTALWWGAQHKIYPSFPVLPFSWLLVAQWTCLGVAFGLLARGFVLLLQFFEKSFFGRLPWPWLRPALGGLLIAALTLFFKDTRYNGLGLQLIDSAFSGTAQKADFAWKSLWTALSSGSGLKGGEVTPLMAIGACFGALIAGWLALPTLYSASLGLIAVFVAASHIPWTGALMAWELFGFEAFLPAFIVCWLARRMMGLQSLFQVPRRE